MLSKDDAASDSLKKFETFLDKYFVLASAGKSSKKLFADLTNDNFVEKMVEK